MPLIMTSQNDATAEGGLVALLPRLRRYARVLTATRDQADALLQATLECASKRKLRRQQTSVLCAGLFAIMHEVHEDKSIQSPDKRPWTPRNVDEYIEDGWQIPDGGSQAGRTEAVETLGNFSRLLVEQREVLMLVAVEGLAYSEIAAVLRVPMATVMARLKNARESMHSMTIESASHERFV